MRRPFPVIEPLKPTPTKAPPVDDEWFHEVKFDGFRARAQVHVDGADVRIYGRSGADITRRFRALGAVLIELPAKNAAIDCELVAFDEAGMPCFRTLMDHRANNAPLCLWAFYLLAQDGVRLIDQPLKDRRAMLADLVATSDTQHIQFSGAFEDGDELLATCERMDLEGVISKRRNSMYRSGPSKD